MMKRRVHSLLVLGVLASITLGLFLLISSLLKTPSATAVISAPSGFIDITRDVPQRSDASLDNWEGEPVSFRSIIEAAMYDRYDDRFPAASYDAWIKANREWIDQVERSAAFSIGPNTSNGRVQIEFTVRDRDPERAAEIANAMAYAVGRMAGLRKDNEQLDELKVCRRELLRYQRRADALERALVGANLSEDVRADLEARWWREFREAERWELRRLRKYAILTYPRSGGLTNEDIAMVVRATAPERAHSTVQAMLDYARKLYGFIF